MTEISIIKDGITINNYKSVGDNSLTDDFIPMIEKRPSSMDSEALKVEFQDYSYPKFGVEIERFQSHDNCHFTAECEVSPLIGFSLLPKANSLPRLLYIRIRNLIGKPVLPISFLEMEWAKWICFSKKKKP